MTSNIIKTKAFNQLTPFLIFFIYFLLSLVAMYPTSSNFGSYKYGFHKGSDSLGNIYGKWWSATINTKNKDDISWDFKRGAPLGSKVSRISIFDLIAPYITKLMGPVWSYNFIIIISFILTGFVMHRFIYYLCKNHFAGFTSGIMFMLSPFHMIQAADHLGLAQTWIFPLVFLLLLKFYEKQSHRNLLYLALSFFVTMWIHGYYALFVLFMIFFVMVYFFIFKFIKIDKNFIKLTAPYMVLCIVALTYWLIKTNIISINLKDFVFFKRSMSNLYTYGIRWYELILPPFYSLFFSGFVKSFLVNNTHGSNYAEMTIFLGYTPIGLSMFFLYKYRANLKQKQISKNKKKRKNLNTIKYLPKLEILWALLIVALIPMLVGPQPEITFFGIKIPTTTKLLYNFLPMYRVLSRSAILTIFATSSLAGLGLYYLIHKRSQNLKILISALTCLFVYLEFTHIHINYYLDTTKVPEVYKEVKNLKDDSLILELPHHWGYMPLFWGHYHQKPLFNIFERSHSNFKTILYIQRERRIENIILKAKKYNIDYLIIHTPQKINIGKVFKNDNTKHTILPTYANFSTLINIHNY